MSSFVQQIPNSDDRERMACAACGHVAYENPKVVAGAVVVFDNRSLMCRRAIELRKAFRARFADPGSPIFAPGEESLEARLFGPDEIPWNESLPLGILGSVRMARFG